MTSTILAVLQIIVWGTFAARYVWVLWSNKWFSPFPVALLACSAVIIGNAVVRLFLRWVEPGADFDHVIRTGLAVIEIAAGLVLHNVLHDARKLTANE